MSRHFRGRLDNFAYSPSNTKLKIADTYRYQAPRGRRKPRPDAFFPRRVRPHIPSLPVLDLIVQKASYFGFTVFLALCGLGLPIPEEAPLVLAGVLSSNGTLQHPSWAFGACLLGALLGDSIMYFIGRRLGHGYLMKHPSFARFIDPEREEKFEHIVTRHGFKLVLLTRFLIGVRGPVYFAAGAARVPYLRFLFWDFIAASIVVSVVFGLGYYFGASIEELIRKVENVLTIFVIAVVVIIAAVGFFHRRMTAALDHLAEEVDEEEAAEAVEASRATPAVSTNGSLNGSLNHDSEEAVDQQSA